jgi:hypothetical protein
MRQGVRSCTEITKLSTFIFLRVQSMQNRKAYFPNDDFLISHLSLINTELTINSKTDINKTTVDRADKSSIS